MSLEPLRQRRSVPSRLLAEPGPDATQLRQLLEAAIRVPDHGRLLPYRLLLLRGGARARLGEALARIHAQKESGLPESVLEKDRSRFTRAPLVVIVIARIDEAHRKIPAQEQLLSAGCVAYNLLLGAQALGFGAQWLTGWPAYDAQAATLLGLAPGERVIAFVHIGSVSQPAPERPRPALADLVSEWT